ncbi:hypothetical protein D3C84_860990 [compost metagenome]
MGLDMTVMNGIVHPLVQHRHRVQARSNRKIAVPLREHRCGSHIRCRLIQFGHPAQIFTATLCIQQIGRCNRQRPVVQRLERQPVLAHEQISFFRRERNIYRTIVHMGSPYYWHFFVDDFC